MKQSFEFPLRIVPKPRMTRSDKWNKRDCVERYRNFKTELQYWANILHFNLPDSFKITFYIKMPNSWSNKKKEKHNNTPHTPTPDLDNCLKSIMDCLAEDKDSYVWNCHAVKLWSDTYKIVIENIDY